MDNIALNTIEVDSITSTEESLLSGINSNHPSQEFLIHERNSDFFVVPDIQCIAGILKYICICCFYIVQRLAEEVHSIELLFITMASPYSLMCQMFFLTMCDLALLSYNQQPNNVVDTPPVNEETPFPQHIKMINGLSTLLLYSVFSYFVSKLREIGVIRTTTRTNRPMRDLFRWVLRIIIEWIKVIVLVICLKEQGLRYEPEFLYTIVTILYYFCTEKVIIEIFTSLITRCDITCLDSLEYLYVPIMLNTFSIISACLIVGNLIKTEHFTYALIASYFTIYLHLKDLVCNQVLPLLLELKTFASFRIATLTDLQNWNDICAVCLNQMSRARITPCNHFFHPYCLKRCLQSSFQCPLCKQSFIQDTATTLTESDTATAVR